MTKGTSLMYTSKSNNAKFRILAEVVSFCLTDLEDFRNFLNGICFLCTFGLNSYLIQRFHHLMLPWKLLSCAANKSKASPLLKRIILYGYSLHNNQKFIFRLFISVIHTSHHRFLCPSRPCLRLLCERWNPDGGHTMSRESVIRNQYLWWCMFFSCQRTDGNERMKHLSDHFEK